MFGAGGLNAQDCFQVPDAVELLASIDCLDQLGSHFSEGCEYAGNAVGGLVCGFCVRHWTPALDCPARPTVDPASE